MNINWLIWIELTELRCWKESVSQCFSSFFWFSHPSINNMMACTCSLVLRAPRSSHWVTEAYAHCTLACSCFHFFVHSLLTFMEEMQNPHAVRKCNYLVHPVLSAINRSLYRSNGFLWLLLTSYLLTSLIVSWPLARRWHRLSVVINSWHLLCWACWWLVVVVVPGTVDWEIEGGGGHSERESDGPTRKVIRCC